VEEAIFFHRKLHDADMPFGALVVNRLHRAPDGDSELPPELAEDLARKVDTASAELKALAASEQVSLARLKETLGDPPTLVIPELDTDVHDVEGLALMREHLF
jgi:hypothetical protein